MMTRCDRALMLDPEEFDVLERLLGNHETWGTIADPVSRILFKLGELR